MSNNLQIFQNEEFGQIRTVTIDGEPWFVGKDVTENLGYQNGSRDINRHVDEDDRQKMMIFDGNQSKETIVINESGLYSLVLSSKLPSAKKFKRWVTSEVIPTIRKHGAYMTPETIKRTLSDPDFIIQLATQLKEEREKRKALEVEVEAKSVLIEAMQPKASYYDLILQCSGLLSTTEIAKDYGMSAMRFNEILHEHRIQFKQQKNGRWFLYSRFDGNGYTQSKTHNIARADGTQEARTHMYWTQKGRLFLYDFLKKEGILPKIEQEQNSQSELS